MCSDKATKQVVLPMGDARKKEDPLFTKYFLRSLDDALAITVENWVDQCAPENIRTILTMHYEISWIISQQEDCSEFVNNYAKHFVAEAISALAKTGVFVGVNNG